MLCLSVIEPRSFELRGSLFSVVTPPSARGAALQLCPPEIVSQKQKTKNLEK